MYEEAFCYVYSVMHGTILTGATRGVNFPSPENTIHDSALRAPEALKMKLIESRHVALNRVS